MNFGNTTLLDNKLQMLLSLDFLDKVILNTESQKIIDYVKKKYVTSKLKIIKRDPKYSTDEVSNYDFCKYMVSFIDTDYVLYSPVTAPFITKETYIQMYYNLQNNNYDSIILPIDGKQGQGHKKTKHNLCFGAVMMKVEDVIKNRDFIGEKTYFQICNSKERIDIDYSEEFNLALYHYYNKDAIYGNENKLSLKNNNLYNYKENFNQNNELLKDITLEDEPKKEDIKIIDVTIRDGGFVNQWQWVQGKVADMLQASSESNIDYFEIGYLIDESFSKPNDGHYRNVSFDTINEFVNKLKPKCKISVLIDSWRYDFKKLPNKRFTNIDLIRIVVYYKNFFENIKICKLLKELGYEVSLNIAAVSYINMNQLETIKKEVTKMTEYIDYLYLADSFGNMTPDDVVKQFSFLQDLKNIKLGYHIHNNGEVGMANMLASLKYIDILDASYLGIGRGAGNLSLENVILYLNIKKFHNFNLEAFLNYLETVAPFQKEPQKHRDKVKNILLGFLNVHPYRINDLKQLSLYDSYTYLTNLSQKQKFDYKI
tara:strand:+ start:700 stop:2319 length:1620 start_codon:yes stop_codon:yes gene_type:complete